MAGAREINFLNITDLLFNLIALL